MTGREVPVAQLPSRPLQWHRLHPVTPLLRGWAVLVAVLVIVGQQTAGDDGNMGYLISQGWWTALGVLGILLVLGGAMWLSWWRAQYAYDDDSLYLYTGVLARQHRSVRLDRVQAINVTRPLLARLFGLAQLTFEAAGGKGAHIQLGFLTDHRAEQLRADLLVRAAGLHERPADGSDGSNGPDAPAVPASPVAPERHVLEVSAVRVLGASLLSGLTIVAVLVIAVLVVLTIVLRSASPVLTVIVPLVALLSAAFQQFSGRFGFTVAISPDGLRVRHGLLQSVAQTIPPGRVQAVRLSQPLLWRPLGWWEVVINVAGYSQEKDANGSRFLLPVGTPEEALRVLWLVVPELAGEQERALLQAGLLGRSTSVGDPYVAAPRRTWVLDPIAWRRHGYVATQRALLVRGGGIIRRLVVVPHERTQSLGVRQGPWQRRFAVASFHLHSTPGPVHPAVAHLRERDCALLEAEQSARAQQARSVARPDQWMTHPPTPLGAS